MCHKWKLQLPSVYMNFQTSISIWPKSHILSAYVICTLANIISSSRRAADFSRTSVCISVYTCESTFKEQRTISFLKFYISTSELWSFFFTWTSVCIFKLVWMWNQCKSVNKLPTRMTFSVNYSEFVGVCISTFNFIMLYMVAKIVYCVKYLTIYMTHKTYIKIT